MFVQKVKAVATVFLAAAVAVGGVFTHHAAGGSEPGKKGDREPGHAFAPRGGMAVTDDPLKGPSKPVAPPKGGDPRKPAGPEIPDKIDPFRPPRANPTSGTNPFDPKVRPQPVQPNRPIAVEKLDPKLLRGLGNRFDVEVTGRTDGDCWGMEVYFYKSDLDTAAVHAGLLKVGEKAVITVTVVKCPKSAEGNRQNGVTSLPWADAATTDTALLLQRLPAKGTPAVKDPAGLTIDEAILVKPDQKVKVLFEIGSVEWEDLAANDPKGADLRGQEWRLITFHSKHTLQDGRKFVVFLTGAAVTPVFRLGLMKGKDSTGTDYFRGKTVRVTGLVEALEEPVGKVVNYRIIVTDLHNLEVVK